MIDCRHWCSDDILDLRYMLTDLLQSPAGIGAKLKPTEHNVKVLLQLGMQWSLDHEPTLIASVDGKAAGMCLWGNLGNPVHLDMRSKVCTGIGTYVMPKFRRQHVASTLRERAIQIARQRGYNSIEGVAFDEPGELSALAVGFVPVGTQVEYRL